MENEITATPGADSAASGSVAVGGDSQPQSQAGADTSGQGPSGEGSQEAGRSRGADGRFAPGEGGQQAQADRALEDLLNGEPGEMTPGERKIIRMAAKLGLKTQAEVDAHLGKSTKPGTQPPAGTPPANPQTIKDTKGKTEPLAALISAISPNLEPANVDQAVASVKELQRHASQLGERNKELESYYPQVEAGIVSRLQKGEEGLRELYATFNLPAPAFLGAAAATGQPAAVPSAAAPASASPALAELDAMREDEFLQVGQVKGLMGKLAAQVAAQVKADLDKDYKPLKDTHEKIVERIQQDAARAELDTRKASAIKDADFHSTFMGQFDPEAKLKAPAEEIWNASVSPDGQMKTNPHPEWPKLANILKSRHDNFLKGKTDAANYQDYLYRQVLAQGNLFDLVKKAEEKGRSSTLTAQQRRVQPALVNRGTSQGGLDSLVIPKSEEDVKNMTPDQRAELKRRVMKGEITVRSN